MSERGYLILEDGTRFDGKLCGADAHTVGEVVFTTSMSGYQESVTDPSFARQILVFTLPHVGNYGVSSRSMESDKVHVAGVVMHRGMNDDNAPGSEGPWLDWLADCGVPAIDGIDTRRLVRHLRSRGAMRGGIFPAGFSSGAALEEVRGSRTMEGWDLAAEVSTDGPKVLEPLGPGPDVRIATIDCGIKDSIVRNLRERGATVELHNCHVDSQTLKATGADGYFLANGPGDPAALDYVARTVRELLGHRPMHGICLGHQVLCRAVGLETYKLPFGHRGANHPVRDLTTGHVEITSQNHGFAVIGPDGAERVETDDPVTWTTDWGIAQLTHVNLYDRTVEGLSLPDVSASTVQYHPEAGPGPHDSLHLFDRMIDSIAAAR